MRHTEKRKFSVTLLKIIFEIYFSQFLFFLRFSVKEIKFPSREGAFFVAFDHMDLTRLSGSGNNHISVFDYVRLSETFIWSKSTTLLS